MNIAQIEETISNLIKNINPESFIYDLLLAYGLPKASISRLQNGNLNLSKRSGGDCHINNIIKKYLLQN